MYVVVRTSVCACKHDKFLRDRLFDNNEVYNHSSSNQEILFKNRLYLRHCVYSVMEKLLLREVTASFMQLYSLP